MHSRADVGEESDWVPEGVRRTEDSVELSGELVGVMKDDSGLKGRDREPDVLDEKGITVVEARKVVSCCSQHLREEKASHSRTGAALTFPRAIVRALRTKKTGFLLLRLKDDKKGKRSTRAGVTQTGATNCFSSTLTCSVRINDSSSWMGCRARLSK
jgi:hypothetical protein